ncbi:MAG: hypothetical protein GY716_16605 [bacterium]|nr:hypothetical protein [bacterium]
MKRSTMIVIALVLALVTAGAASAALRVVPNQFSTIQEAVDNSSPGDTVLVRPGQYRESVTVDVANLTVRGMTCARRTAVVDGGMGGTVFTVEADDVRLACMTLRHGSDAVYGDGGDGIAIDRLTILRPQGYGIYLEAGENFSITDTTVVSPEYSGVYVGDGSDGSITGTTVRGSNESCFSLYGVDNLDFARNSAHGCSSYALEAYGDSMTFSRNTFRSNYYGVYWYGDGAEFDDNTIDSSCYGDDGLYFDGNDNTVSNNVVTNCYYDGISSHGDRNTIRDNEVSAVTDNYCLEVYGNDNDILDNTCSGAYYGLYFEGDGVEIRRNTFDSALYSPIEAYGDDALIVDNVVRNAYDGLTFEGANGTIAGNETHSVTWSPFSIYGENPVVTDNTGNSGAYSVFAIFCHTDCSTAEVSDNVATNAVGGESCFHKAGGVAAGCGEPLFPGFFIGSEEDGITISDNSSTDNQGSGFELYVDSATISSNVVRRNGAVYGVGGGFVVRGDDNDLDDNVAADNQGAGFEVQGSGNTLTNNVAERNLLEGFWLWGKITGNVLTGNIARNNHAEGFDNEGSSTDLSQNTSFGNRTDCTNDGSLGTNTGNVCSDDSDFSSSGEIDRNVFD